MNSLHTSDIFQLVFICAVVFIPFGFALYGYIIRKKVVLKHFAKFQTKLSDKGSFNDFINGGQK
ncbi:hypothetical protein [Succinivibrio sp.]|uniref:hypothetical protein n=1 Tax=Succinivibrio sp. TaxID=2053619 RepID=UPI00386AEC1B